MGVWSHGQTLGCCGVPPIYGYASKCTDKAPKPAIILNDKARKPAIICFFFPIHTYIRDGRNPSTTLEHESIITTTDSIKRESRSYSSETFIQY